MSALLLTGSLKIVLLCLIPFILILGLVGLAFAFLQGATGIQDQASTQGVRLATALLVGIFAGPWVLETLSSFTVGVWRDLAKFLH